jgi:hypothetical protein
MRLLLILLLAGCAGTRRAAPGWRAGTGRAVITPAEPLRMAGYGSRNKPSEGVAADLWARALALEDGEGRRALIVTADIIEFDPVQSPRIKEELRRRHGLGPEQVLLVGSHTHSGPEVDEKTSYPALFRAGVLQAADRALAGLEPASLTFGRGSARFGMNRRVKHPDGTWRFGKEPAGATDPDLPMLRVAAASGLKALVYTYACHCTSVRNRFEGFYRIHPDWAAASSIVESARPGLQAMFVAGCGGDIDPQPTGALDVAEAHARTMAEALEEGLAKAEFRPVPGPLALRLRRIELPVDRPAREAYAKQAESAKGADRAFAKEMLAKLDAGTAPLKLDYPIAVWEFGRSLALVGLAGETCVDYALRLKREAGGRELWVAGYCNEVVCYIPSERVLDEGGYEAGWHLQTGRGLAAMQMAWAGFPAPFAPGIEDRIVRTVHEMLGERP